MNLEDLFTEIQTTFDKATDAQLHSLLTHARDLVDGRIRAASPVGMTESEKSMSSLQAIKSIRDRMGVGLVVAKKLYEQWTGQMVGERR